MFFSEVNDEQVDTQNYSYRNKILKGKEIVVNKAYTHEKHTTNSF